MLQRSSDGDPIVANAQLAQLGAMLDSTSFDDGQGALQATRRFDVTQIQNIIGSE